MSRSDEIRTFLVEHGLLSPSLEVGDQDSLLLSGIIDSLAILELTAFIETEYQCRVEGPDLVPENFDTLGAISDYIDRKQSPNV